MKHRIITCRQCLFQELRLWVVVTLCVAGVIIAALYNTHWWPL